MKKLLGVFALTSAGIFTISTIGCSLVVDTDPLTAGKAGLSCKTTEKICPLDDESCVGSDCSIERFECVEKTSPERGCGDESCQPCVLPGAVARCSKEKCAIAVCSGQHENCDKLDDNGCEVDLALDPDNCGGCGRTCERDNAITDCVEGICRTVICVAPWDDCDEKADNGCETNTDDSLLHCGGCKKKCDGSCADGICTL